MFTMPGYTFANDVSRMVTDWSVIRELVASYLETGNHPQIKLNDYGFRQHSREISRWHGYDVADLKEWVTTGYKSNIFGKLEVSPVREKRRYIYAEEQEEMHIDRVLSGEDNYMGGFTKRAIIPGVSIEADIMFSSSTDATIVNAYNVFICQCIQSLDASGIDCEVTLNFNGRRSVGGHQGLAESVVRVKRQNEQSNFSSYSAMFSPAALRTFGFFAMILHSEVRNRNYPPGLGNGSGFDSWEVKFDRKQDKIRIRNPYSPGRVIFPATDMKLQFEAVIKEITG